MTDDPKALRAEADSLRSSLVTAGSAEAKDIVSRIVALDERWVAATSGVQAPAKPALDPGRKLGFNTTGTSATVALRVSHVVTSVAHVLDAPLVTVTVQRASHGENWARLGLSAWIEGFSARDTRTLEIERNAAAVAVDLFPTFFPDALQRVNEMTRAALHIEVVHLKTGEVEIHETHRIWLLSRNSACLFVTDPKTGTKIDLTDHLGAWVTPNAPAVMDMVRNATERHPQRNMVGYQRGETDVEKQLIAVFEALHAHGIKYVHSWMTSMPDGADLYQRVRLPSESLRTRSANCIDGTVLVASVLEAASLEPAIVLVPGHAYLAWRRQRDGEWDYLETTKLASGDFALARDIARDDAEKRMALKAKYPDAPVIRLVPVREMRNRSIVPME